MRPVLIPRPAMPQLAEADLPDFLQWVNKWETTVAHEDRDPDTLQAHQRVNWKRAEAIPERIRRKPILIAEDGFILDGHHRAAACHLHGEQVSCHVLSRPFFPSMGLLYLFPRTTEGAAA